VLTAKQGQLDDIITRLSQTTGVLSNRAQDIASTIADLPGALESAHAGLQRLDATLLTLQDTASSARPVAKTLNAALRHANPVLIQAVPVVRQLDRLLIDAEPVVQHLVPATRGYTSVLEGVGGPVLDRINGPVKKVVLGAYHGAGPYAGTGSDKPLYQELGYMFATLDRASSMVDRNGHTVALQPGVGPGSMGGLPISLEQMFTVLTNKFNLTPRNGGK
jgi:phospholipid/cholesterol/gamma-HCH transport system substrate-binding protein